MNVYDPVGKCPKCGGRMISTHYEKDCRSKHQEEVIRRKCERCGYSWAESPLDTGAQKEAEK